MTWGELKHAVEEAGATDETEIIYIDISSFTRDIVATLDADGLVVS